MRFLIFHYGKKLLLTRVIASLRCFLLYSFKLSKSNCFSCCLRNQRVAQELIFSSSYASICYREMGKEYWKNAASLVAACIWPKTGVAFVLCTTEIMSSWLFVNYTLCIFFFSNVTWINFYLLFIIPVHPCGFFRPKIFFYLFCLSFS